jgi:hypothetical protein
MLAPVHWIADASGSWHTASNWDTGIVPGPGDEVIIDRPAGDLTITYSSGNTTVQSIQSTEALAVTGGSLTIAGNSQLNALAVSGGTLTGNAVTVINALSLSGGTFGGAGAVTVTGPTTWTGSDLSGSGQMVAQGGLTISGSSDKWLRGYRLTNAGPGTWTGTGWVVLTGGPVFTNQAGASFEIQTDRMFYQLTDPLGTFQNAGTVSKSAGTGTTEIQMAFHNTGTVQVQSGILLLDRGGISSGSFSVAEAATLNFGGGTHELQPGSRVAGAGTVDFAGGTVNAAGTYHITGRTRISGGTLNFAAGADVQSVGPALEVSDGTANVSSGVADKCRIM